MAAPATLRTPYQLLRATAGLLYGVWCVVNGVRCLMHGIPSTNLLVDRCIPEAEVAVGGLGVRDPHRPAAGAARNTWAAAGAAGAAGGCRRCAGARTSEGAGLPGPAPALEGWRRGGGGVDTWGSFRGFSPSLGTSSTPSCSPPSPSGSW